MRLLTLFLICGILIAQNVCATPVVYEDGVDPEIKSRVRREDHYFDWIRDLLLSMGADGSAVPGNTQSTDQQYCILYSALDGDVTRGSSYTVTFDISNLEEVGWKHVVSAMECYGLWLIYKEPHFNGDGTGGVGYLFKDKPELVSFDNELWSHWNNLVVGLRRVGPRYHPLTTDSITLYEHEWYMGEQYYTDADIPRLPMRINNKVTSVIITGTADWSLYSGAEYSGESECIRAEDDGTTAIKLLLFLNEQVTSVKRGC